MKIFTGISNIQGTLKKPNFYFEEEDAKNLFCNAFNIFYNNYQENVFTLKVDGYLYSIVFLGNIYNLKSLISHSNFECSTNSNEEFVLKSYIYNNLFYLNDFSCLHDDETSVSLW